MTKTKTKTMIKTKTLRSSEEQSMSQQQLTLQEAEVRSQLQKLEESSNGDSARLGDTVVVVVVVVVVVDVVVVVVVVELVVVFVVGCVPLGKDSVTLSSFSISVRPMSTVVSSLLRPEPSLGSLVLIFFAVTWL